MNCLQLPEKEQKLLLNKIFKITVIFTALFILLSCADKGDDVLPRIEFDNKIQLIELSKKTLGNEVVSAFGGFFDDSPRKKIAVIIETDENIEWGIKFVLLEEVKGKLETKFQSRVISGSHKESFLDKIKFPSFDYELLYYNSQGYFMGTGGGEVYSYIVDFGTKEIYYAHLVLEARRTPSLFISANTVNKDVRNFFIQIFRKDYPNLKTVEEDITLE